MSIIPDLKSQAFMFNKLHFPHLPDQNYVKIDVF